MRTTPVGRVLPGNDRTRTEIVASALQGEPPGGWVDLRIWVGSQRVLSAHGQDTEAQVRIHIEQDRLAYAALQAHKQVEVTMAAYRTATQERREAVINLRDAGWSLGRIATFLGV
jgi:hypothetical protein